MSKDVPINKNEMLEQMVRESTKKLKPSEFKSVIYTTDHVNKIAYITLNRPHRFNAIDYYMPQEIRTCVQLANIDSKIHCIIINGNGKFFCSGYDLKLYAESSRGNPCSQNIPWDPNIDHSFMGENDYPISGCTSCYMSLFNSKKPTIACIHGGAIAGGSDIVLCCDIILMTNDCLIGYPPSKLWGVPTTAMWSLKVGIQFAKYLLFTGELINGIKSKKLGLCLESYKNKKILDDECFKLAKKISNVPCNQLWFNKIVINQIADNQCGGFNNIQRLASLLDGASRHTPEGIAFQQYCQKYGFKEAVKIRDSGNDMSAIQQSKL